MTPPEHGVFEEFVAALALADEEAARAVATRMIAGSDEGVRRLADHLIPDALEEVGRRWESAEWTVAQEHLATAICEGIVATILDETEPSVEPRRCALIVCAEGEWHSLASRVVAVAVRLAGLHPVVLGPSVSSSQLAAAIFDSGPEFVALTCSMIANLPGAHRMIATCHETATPIAVGGRAFGHSDERAKRLGADGWANKSFEVVAFAGDLRRGIEPATGRHIDPDADIRLLDSSAPAVLDELSARLGMDHAMDGEFAAGGVWMLRTLQAALLCDERRLLTEQIRWHEGRARLGQALPAAVVCRALLGALPDQAEVAARWVAESAEDATIDL